MATFFGEILPVKSRAVDIDDEDEYGDDVHEGEGEDDFLRPVIADSVVWWSPIVKDEPKIKTRAVIIASGSAATGFTRTYILSREAELIGCGHTIGSDTDDKTANSFSQDAPTDKSCMIYRIKDYPVILVQCHIKILPEQSFGFVDQLLSRIDLSDAYVAVMSNTRAEGFKGEKSVADLEPPFVRSLKTHPFKGTPVWPYLEQPNTISGFPAQVLSYCHVRNRPCVIYCLYTDTPSLDLGTINQFKPLLTATPIKDVFLEPPDARKKLKNLVALHHGHNNLYI